MSVVFSAAAAPEWRAVTAAAPHAAPRLCNMTLVLLYWLLSSRHSFLGTIFYFFYFLSTVHESLHKHICFIVFMNTIQYPSHSVYACVPYSQNKQYNTVGAVFRHRGHNTNLLQSSRRSKSCESQQSRG